jgi:uncharacterized protein YjbJ (UPF0337 family)
MNKERFAGLCLQLVGKLNEAWGEWIGDTRRSADGRRDQVIGKARQAGAMEHELADRQLAEFHDHHRNLFF